MGILTNRDLRFETRFDIPINKVMTKENLITVPVGTTLEEAEEILHKHRVEKLLVVDDKYNLKGLITVKDIQKKLKYPNAAKDSHGSASRSRRQSAPPAIFWSALRNWSGQKWTCWQSTLPTATPNACSKPSRLSKQSCPKSN